LITVIIAVAAISIGTFVAYYSFQSYLQSRRVPTEQELPDKVILDNQRDLIEVKTFLSKYPNATVFVERSGNIDVWYDVWHQVSEDPKEMRRLMLRVLSDNDGKPQERYLSCLSTFSGQHNPTSDGRNFYLISKDIVNYIETEKCWTAPFSRQ
jgi:hypothetical protein